MKEAYIDIKNINKTIGNNVVLDNISISLEKGKIYGFRGKNGSGKTMLFRAICGLINVDSGEIIIDNKVLGKDISFPNSLGVLIEYPGFLDNLTGFRNLKYLAEIKGIISDKDIEEAIKKVGLDPKDTRKFKKYSLGMKQRLGIAQAIMEDPELIILDEPTNALDIDGVRLINDIILDMKSKGKTILIANHDKEELESVADKILFVDRGRIIDEVK
ncbi:ATP-binding cassette domain-containing protein [Clostridium bornimense]|uniref:ATP-binding cassette domain-containing protein n=1 Tax=Clostridium bornimense TaxID=1216932 RepID=UPI001C0F827A|nr:ATP-binding cassette domain-containing protein [Clostridium bornimense]MBU5317014.1 ATP-binding cassette domain-containing protein [Clostridium bornimense]